MIPILHLTNIVLIIIFPWSERSENKENKRTINQQSPRKEKKKHKKASKKSMSSAVLATTKKSLLKSGESKYTKLVWNWLRKASLDSKWESGLCGVICEYLAILHRFSRTMAESTSRPQDYDFSKDDLCVTKKEGVSKAANCLIEPVWGQDDVPITWSVRIGVLQSQGYYCLGVTSVSDKSTTLHVGCVCYYDNRVAVKRVYLSRVKPFSRSLQSGDVVQISVERQPEKDTVNVKFLLESTGDSHMQEWEPSSWPICAGIYTNLAGSPGSSFEILP